MNLIFPYHEGVIFSALTQEMVFSTEKGKQSSVRPSVRGKHSLVFTGNSKGEADTHHCGQYWGPGQHHIHTPSQRQFQLVTPNT